MMSNRLGWAALGLAIFTMIGMVGNEIIVLGGWDALTTPSFVGKLLIHLSVVGGAFFAGKYTDPAK